MSSQLTVVAGKGSNRTNVGSITAVEGMLTNQGRVTRVTEKTVFIEGRAFRNLADVSVRHSEAFSYGYPNAAGCKRNKQQMIRRNGKTISA